MTMPKPVSAKPSDLAETKDRNDSAAAVEQTVSQDNEGGQEPDSFSREYVEKLRREAASLRKRYAEVKPYAEKYKQLEDEKKSDLERANERIAELEGINKAYEQDAVRVKVAAKAGIPPSLLPASGTEQELEEAAEALVQWAHEQKAEKKLPEAPSVGRESGGTDRDEMARSILGI